MSIGIPMRECRKCGLEAYTESDLTQFASDTASMFGKKNLCIRCHCESTREYTNKNREEINKKKKDKKKESSEKRKNADYKLRARYGITLNDYDAMLEKQNSCCAICKTDNPKSNGRFMVDHNHETGEVRGLLCTTCNGALGKFGDSILILESAIKYLKERGSYGK